MRLPKDVSRHIVVLYKQRYPKATATEIAGLFDHDVRYVEAILKKAGLWAVSDVGSRLSDFNTALDNAMVKHDCVESEFGYWGQWRYLPISDGVMPSKDDVEFAQDILNISRKGG